MGNSDAELTNPLTDEQKTEAIKEYQRQTMGSETYWSLGLAGYHGFRYTDGVRFVAKTCGASWLIMAILSYQFKAIIYGQPLQAWSLTADADGDRWTLTCEDGNGEELVRQRIPYSDFPKGLSGFRIWVENKVLYLPEER